jgi:hypothetical protein
VKVKLVCNWTPPAAFFLRVIDALDNVVVEIPVQEALMTNDSPSGPFGLVDIALRPGRTTTMGCDFAAGEIVYDIDFADVELCSEAYVIGPPPTCTLQKGHRLPHGERGRA